MIAFIIENQQLEYSKCFSIIHFLHSGEEFHLNSPVKILLLKDYEIKSSGKYNFNLIYNKCINFERIVEATDNVSLSTTIQNFLDKTSFCFFVKNMDENDLVHLHYFELIRQYENECYLLIESNDENFFRISDFYQVESHLYPSTYSNRFFKSISEDKVKRFAINNNNLSRHFLPLLRTDPTTYSILSKNIFEVFSFSSEELLNPITVDGNYDHVKVEKLIHSFCIKLIKEINTYIKTKYVNFYWDKYKEFLSHTSVLGLCYFLSYLHSTISNKTFSINESEITHLLLQSEDFSMGTMQLFENALKHADYGFFCYRIHFSKSKETYLKNNYNISYNDETAPFYLEVLVSDFNESYDIPKKFIQNIKSRPSFKTRPELVKTLEEELELKDFFTPTDKCKKFWHEYYSDKSNIALHYGLNIFEQIITSSGGKFVLNSSNKVQLSPHEFYGRELNKRNDTKRFFPHIPGTQYKIILPIKDINFRQKSTGLKVKLDTPQLKKKWKQYILHFTKKENLYNKIISENDILFSEFKRYDPQYKESSVIKLTDILKNKVCDLSGNTILVFDVNEFSTSMESEVFGKALICLLGSIHLKKIAIINASQQFMSMFIRIFGLLYYKEVSRDFLIDRDIYICGDFNLEVHNNVEIIFNGEDIRNSLLLSKQIADYKGEYSSELSVLENIANKCEKTKGKKRVSKMFPFDVLIKTNKGTLFQEKTVYDLQQDLQHYNFGCRLSDVHMKVGSKIHITKDFYEATLLFGIENYISRFAYLLSKRISENVKMNKNKEKIVLIGYETYSEMLVIETQRILSNLFKINTKYLIYEDSAKHKKFRGVEKINDFEVGSSKYVIIVPIGSTLTTHDKILAELRRQFGLNDNENVIANLCVVLIRDEIENNNVTNNEKVFWSYIDETHVVLSEDYDIGNKNRIDYIVSINNKWENPDFCQCCFPEKLSEEKPILKVNKASVIPMIMIGIKETNALNTSQEHMHIQYGDISELRNHMKYGHYERGDNHFEYYFNTETLSLEIAKTEAFANWLKEVKRNLKGHQKGNNTLEYNFVVAPQHPTNAEFVTQVNEKVFQNPASIIFLDVKKEYRDNIKTKFSNITQLYNNLYTYGKNATINFHYVDDTITTGETFNRTKTLIQSLFPEKAFSKSSCNNIKVNVFSSVIVLLGRCSFDTKLNYVEKGRFFNYFELNISSLRNHEDACILCKKHDDFEEMRKLSATNSMERAFAEEAKKYYVIPYDDITAKSAPYGFERMVITHELNKKLNELQHNKNNKNDVKMVLLQFIENLIKETYKADNNGIVYTTKLLCTFLLVISSPFITFRKSVLTISFELLLKIADFLLFDREIESDDYFGNEFKDYISCIEYCSNTTILEEFIQTVFSAISYLGSNYLMRIDVINAFFFYVKQHFSVNSNNDVDEKWIIYYCKIMNQTLMLNKQDSRVLWLEKILKTGIEKKLTSTSKLDSNKNIDMVKKVMLLENTLILSDTLDEAIYSIQNTITNMKNDIFNEICMELNNSVKLYYLKEGFNNFTKISENTNTDLVLKILFTGDGYLRNRDEFKKTLENTVQAYFCEAFRSFSNINYNFNNVIERLLDMTILNLLLMPNSSLFGAREEHLKFYNFFINQIKLVLNVQKVQLFMCRDEYIDFICSSDDNNVECDAEYENYIKDILTGNQVSSIADTYYYCNKNCLNAIKIVNNSTDDKCDFNAIQSAKKTAWYLVFETTPKLSIEERLTNARNLLVMRENLLMRFRKDYDNNLYAEFSELRNKVKKLTDDKAGGHTPFAELSQDFDYLCNLSNDEQNNHGDQVANFMKLITDLLISKLYVCHINDDSYPVQIEARADDMQYNVLSNYRHIMLYANYLVLRKENSLTITPKISFEGIDWDTDFSFMKKSEFIWVSIFYALIMNSLRHGLSIAIDEDEFNRSVYIEVKTDKKYLIITNDYIEKSSPDRKNGITLDTVSAFFSHYGYAFIIDELPKEQKFVVKIPLTKEKRYEEET